MDVYCRVQKIMDEVAKILLEFLQLSGTALIWWESKMKVYMVQKGKVVYPQDKFTKAIKKQFYPLAHTQMKMIEWKYLRQGKGQNIQAYTEEFKKKALYLGIALFTHETLLNCIGVMNHIFVTLF
jgi:isopentenyl phosphate kinase